MTTNTPAQVAVKPDLRATIERLIEDAMIDAEVDYPAGSDAGHRISWDSDSLLNGIMALIPAPAPAEQAEPAASWIEAMHNILAMARPFMRDDAQALALELAEDALFEMRAHPAPVPAVPEKVATVDRFVCDYNRDFRLHPQGDWVRCSDHAFAIEAQAAEIALLKKESDHFNRCWDVQLARAEAAEAEVARLTEELARVRELINHAASIFTNCEVTDGSCCCGDSMDNHPHPMNCGHSPVDHGSYVVDGWMKKYAALAQPADDGHGEEK